ncbi:MAG TPA: hypothetical protein VIW22_01625 [Nitrososphaerales archaeon]
MADPTVIAILTFLHIASAIGWLGAVVFFLSVIGPSVRKFTPAASLEFLTKVGPRQIRYFAGVATSTIVFGLALLFAAFGTDYSAWPRYIEAGFSLGLLAYLIALVVVIPSFLRVEKIAHQIMSNPQAGPPPPELARYLKRGNQAVVSVALILLLALLFMVLSAVFG